MQNNRKTKSLKGFFKLELLIVEKKDYLVILFHKKITGFCYICFIIPMLFLFQTIYDTIRQMVEKIPLANQFLQSLNSVN